MKNRVKQLLALAIFLCAFAFTNESKAQSFPTNTLVAKNATSCDIIVYLEYFDCTGCVCYYATLVSYVVPAGTAINIPVTAGDDASMWVDFPGDPWLGPVSHGCAPPPTFASGTLSSNCTVNGTYNIDATTPGLLYVY